MMLMGLALTACSRIQGVNPNLPTFNKPVRTAFKELRAYNIPGSPPQQLWEWNEIEHILRFDENLNCFYESWRRNGTDIKFDTWCMQEEVHWTRTDPRCLAAPRTFNVTTYIDRYWWQFEGYTVYEGVVDDPFYPASLRRYHRIKHRSDPRWIWINNDSLNVVYEQYYDGTYRSYISYYNYTGIGFLTNMTLQDFKISICPNTR